MRTWPPRWRADSETRPAAGLPARLALGRRLDAVVAAVADQVRQRVGQRLQDGLVQLDVGAGRSSSICLPSWRARSRTMRGKLVEEIADRLHPRSQDGVLQFAGDRVEPLHDGPQAGVGGVDDRSGLVAHQHQLAGQRHEPIDQADRDADAVGGVGAGACGDGAAWALPPRAAGAGTPRTTGGGGDGRGDFQGQHADARQIEGAGKILGGSGAETTARYYTGPAAGRPRGRRRRRRGRR